MVNSIRGRNSPSRSRKSSDSKVTWGSRLGDRTDAVPSMTDLHFRRLRYFLNLLVAGYRHVMTPEPLFDSLRGERIALGIDVPELDTVSLWSVRRGDGKVSVPFIEFILGQICEVLDALCNDPAHALTSPAQGLAACRSDLGQIVEQISAAGGPAPFLPRMHDLFVEEALLERICGSGGLHEQIERQIESLLTARIDSPEH